MHLNEKILGLSAFVSYFGLDALTTCAGVLLFGIGAESNPAMAIALGSGGLAVFLLVKLALSLGLVIPSFILSLQPGSKAVGTSALAAIMAGGALAAINNVQVLVTGSSFFSAAFGHGSYFGPGLLIAAAMLVIGIAVYAMMSLKDRKFGVRAHL